MNDLEDFWNVIRVKLVVSSVWISLSLGFTVLGLDFNSFKLRFLLRDLGRLNFLRRYLHNTNGINGRIKLTFPVAQSAAPG